MPNRTETHLCDEGSVLLADVVVEVLAAVVDISDEDLSVQHGRVAELCAMSAAQQPPRELALVHHRRDHVARALQSAPPELEPTGFRHAAFMGCNHNDYIKS